MNTFLKRVAKASTGKSGQLCLTAVILLFGFASLGAACVYWDWSDLSESEACRSILALQRNPPAMSVLRGHGRDLWIAESDADFWPDDLAEKPQFMLIGFEKDVKLGKVESAEVIEVRRIDEQEFSEFPGTNKHLVTVLETGSYWPYNGPIAGYAVALSNTPAEGRFTIERDYLFVHNGPSWIPATGIAGWSIWPLEYQYNLEFLSQFDKLEEVMEAFRDQMASSSPPQSIESAPNRFMALLTYTSEFMPQTGCYRRNFRHYRLTCNDK